MCDGYLLNGEDLEVHYIFPKKDGVSDKFKNLVLLHKDCHKQVTHSKNKKLKAVWLKQHIIV